MTPAPSLQTDYLIIGAGAAGLAFADTLIEHSDAHVTLVDRHGKPGGHWNDAYSFVTLHQPSSFYGVEGLALGSGQLDTHGPNAGFGELASGAEVAGYYDRVLNHRLLPSGRVRWMPLANHLGDGRVESLLTGTVTPVTVRRRIVDATLYSPAVPSTHTPRFDVGQGVDLVPPNALPGLWHSGRRPRHFVVLGAGKTAIDACAWLLQSGAAPESITWVRPRDPWLIHRATTQDTPGFFAVTLGAQADMMEALAETHSGDEFFARLESAGVMLRIDPAHRPTMFHFATVAPGEVDLVRRIQHVVRLGRVQALRADAMQLDHGTVPVPPGTLFVDCTASVVEPRPLQPVFAEGRIALQILRMPQPAFSAALTARIETLPLTDAQKNRLAPPVPFRPGLEGYPLTLLANGLNQQTWMQQPELRAWIRASRLDGFGKLIAGANRDDPAQAALLARLKSTAMAAAASAPRWLAMASHGAG